MHAKGPYHDLIRDYKHPKDSEAGRRVALETLKTWSDAIEAKDLDTLRKVMDENIVIELPFNESGKTDKESYRIYRGMEAPFVSKYQTIVIVSKNNNKSQCDANNKLNLIP